MAAALNEIRPRHTFKSEPADRSAPLTELMSRPERIPIFSIARLGGSGYDKLAVFGICGLAALAPVSPSTVLAKGLWVSGTIVVLRWRKMTTPDFLAIFFAVWASTTAIGTGWAPAASLAAGNFWSVCLLFVAVRSTIATQQYFNAAGITYLAGCIYASLEIIQQGRVIQPGADTSGIRLGVEGVNPNYTAYALATGVMVAVALLHVNTFRKPIQAAIATAALVLIYGTVWTGTRGALVAIILALAYTAISKFAPAAAWRIAICAAPLLLTIVPLGLYGDTRLLWIEDYFARAGASLSGRLDIWPIARAEWAGHLWTGVGPGMFPLSNSMGIGAHSLVLTLGVELGVIGLMIFLITITCAFFPGSRSSVVARQLLGLLLITFLPIWLSGMWELSPTAWLIFALWSRLPSQPDRLATPDGQYVAGRSKSIRH